jgi:PhzF family phenazine biosynthesis protein
VNSSADDGQLSRLTAFSTDPAGGNPAGVWIGAELPDSDRMQQIAADVGYSETAFAVPGDNSEWTVRYFSPEAEVPFCGHATIATGVVLGNTHGFGTYHLNTVAGRVDVEVSNDSGSPIATLTSVEPEQTPLSDRLLEEVLDSIGWTLDVLDTDLPPGLAYAGAWHVILATSHPDVLSELEYDFDRLKQLMIRHDITTIQLVHRTGDASFKSRNPFPVGGVVEDPATGAAAAALGGYLRASGLIQLPADFTINQGDDMGRPSVLHVHVPESGGVKVSGTAVPISQDQT